MPATNPVHTPVPHPAPSMASAGSDQPAWLQWFHPQVRRMVLWIGIAVIGTYAMGSATNHFFSKDSKDKEANVSGSAPASGSDGASRHGIWWNPATDPIDASSKDSGVTFDSRPSSSSPDGHSIIPVERNAGFSSGSLIMNGVTRIGSNSATYAVLGLGTRSFSSSSMSPSIATDGGSLKLHFSLGGDLTRVPVDNLATGGSNVLTLVAVPEPSTAGLLAMALAGFALRRRRRPATVA